MTTSQVRIQPCSEERCEAWETVPDEVIDRVANHGGALYRCHKPRSEHDANALGHGFTPHTHVKECDARFYETVFGCEIFRGADGTPTYCDKRGDHVHERHVGEGAVWTWGTVRPVLSDPSKVWEAVPVMLKEAERRGLTEIEIGRDPDTAWIAAFSKKEWDTSRISYYDFDSVDDLPRALALALWNAVAEEGS